MIDTKTGRDVPAKNNLHHVKTSDGKLIQLNEPTLDMSQDLDATVESEPNSAGLPTKEKKVGFLKAKFSNLINSTITSSKPRERKVQNIVEIRHLLEERPGGADNK